MQLRVIIAGTDGAGKSTLGNMLKQMIGQLVPGATVTLTDDTPDLTYQGIEQRLQALAHTDLKVDIVTESLTSLGCGSVT